MRHRVNAVRSVAPGLICLGLAACSGGGSGAPSTQAPGGAPQDWVAGQFLPAETFEARCAAPRTELDDATGLPLFPDTQGSALDENNWLRSWTNDLYLWYDEVADQDPALFADPLEYFNELRTFELTPSGKPRDRFHFTLDTEQWLAESQSGISAGYGMEIAVLNPVPPRLIVVAYTHPGSPASNAGLSRGYRVLSVDGSDAVNGNTQAIVDVLNAGLFPQGSGQTHSFEFSAPGGGAPQLIELTSEEVTKVPVQHVSTVTSPQGAVVGYLHFSDHIAPAEEQLLNAIEFMETQNIEDLVIDLRYNSGGFLAIAAQLSYMIAGETLTSGRIFESLQFNAKHPTTNPITGNPLAPLPFLDVTIGLSDAPENQPLPSLDLSRVFVITGPQTCSASESIINSLRGVGVEVIQIGSQTCGKPYGFYPTDNCGTTYFSIQFRGVNDAGFGDYADGFAPAGNGPTTESDPPGCAVPDDFDFPLGDVSEARLAAALQYRDSATCPLVASNAEFSHSTLRAAQGSQPEDSQPATQLAIQGKPPWRTNRILTPRHQ